MLPDGTLVLGTVFMEEDFRLMRPLRRVRGGHQYSVTLPTGHPVRVQTTWPELPVTERDLATDLLRSVGVDVTRVEIDDAFARLDRRRDPAET